MSSNIAIVIIITSLATYLSRFLGVVSAEKIKETSKLFKWFNCLAYSTLAALIARIVIFPSGDLSETTYFSRIMVIILGLSIFLIFKKNYVIPVIFSLFFMTFFHDIF
tara:strand:+ start:575 stop:898 length:324 start_codon:yes stop_codon:yes gene_type:complete